MSEHQQYTKSFSYTSEKQGGMYTIRRPDGMSIVTLPDKESDAVLEELNLLFNSL